MMTKYFEQKNYKSFQEIEYDNVEEIKIQFIEYLKLKTNFLTDENIKDIFHNLNIEDVLKFCPELIKFFKKIKILCKQLNLIYISNHMNLEDLLPLHIHAPRFNFQINIPIFNTENFWTEWYEIPKSIDINYEKLFKNYNLDLRDVDIEELKCLGKINVHKNPIIFNVLIAHRVITKGPLNFPRIILTAIPLRDISHLMKKN